MVGAARPVWWSKMREVMCAETRRGDKSTAPADRLRAASIRLPRHRSSSAPQSTPALTRTPAAGARVAGTCAASLRVALRRRGRRAIHRGRGELNFYRGDVLRCPYLHTSRRHARGRYRRRRVPRRVLRGGVVPARRRCRAVHRFDPRIFVCVLRAPASPGHLSPLPTPSVRACDLGPDS